MLDLLEHAIKVFTDWTPATDPVEVFWIVVVVMVLRSVLSCAVGAFMDWLAK